METVTDNQKQTEPTMENMADFEKSLKPLEVGQFIKGRVVKVDSDVVLVDIGYKAEGLIPFNELSLKPVKSPSEAVALGDEIEAVVLKEENKYGHPILSKKKADAEAQWKKIIDIHKNNEIVSGTCTEKIKGGLIVNIDGGIRAFLPGSQADTNPMRDLNELVGEVLQVNIIQVDEYKRNVVVSRRKYLEEERSRKRTEVWQNIYEGAVLSGKVVRLANFGAFVDLGGVDGLIHISELSYRRVKHPQEVVKTGDTVEIVVVGVDKEKQKIALSLRQTKPDPWLTVEEKFKVDDVVEGTVTRVVKNYVFVELDEGIEGLIPASELSLERVTRPEDIVKPEQKVKVKIVNMKPLERRILLSMSRLESEALKQEYKPFLKQENSTGTFTVGDLLKSKLTSTPRRGHPEQSEGSDINFGETEEKKEEGESQ